MRWRSSEGWSQAFPGKGFSVEGCCGVYCLAHRLHGYRCCLDVRRLKAKSTSSSREVGCLVCFSLSRCLDLSVLTNTSQGLICCVPSDCFLDDLRPFITSPGSWSNPSKSPGLLLRQWDLKIVSPCLQRIKVTIFQHKTVYFNSIRSPCLSSLVNGFFMR